MNTEIDVFNSLETKLLENTNINKVVKFQKVEKELPFKSDEIYVLVDFLPKTNIKINGKRSMPFLLHLLIKPLTRTEDELSILEEEVRELLGGYTDEVIKKCIYSHSSDIFFEKNWNAWTRHMKFNSEYSR